MDSQAGQRFFAKLKHALHFDALSPFARKVIVGIVGGFVLLAGVAMIFLPGPAFVVIPLGFAILASEFGWARHYWDKARGWIRKLRKKKKSGNAG